MKPAGKKPSFLPIRIHWDLLKTDRLIHLYKFGSLLLPGVSFNGLANLLLDFENKMRKVTLNISPQERDKIQKALQGISIELKIGIHDAQAGELISIPLCIEPASVMERTILGKGPKIGFENQMAELRKLIFEFIKEEFKTKMTSVLERFFEGELFKKTVKKPIQQMVDQGVITKKGELVKEITIDDLLFGKYSGLFAKAATQEILSEGLLIERTLAGLFEWSGLDKEAWTKEAKRELDLIGATLKTLKS